MKILEVPHHIASHLRKEKVSDFKINPMKDVKAISCLLLFLLVYSLAYYWGGGFFHLIRLAQKVLLFEVKNKMVLPPV